MKNEKLFDLIITIVFAIISLVVAYITFGILNSTAELKGESTYTYGGAIAGFIVSFLLMRSAFSQLSGSNDKFRSMLQVNKDLQRQNEELQQKLIRGAPHPSGYEIEVAERQKIVLARPENWVPRGGVIFDFENPDSPENDLLPAHFRLSYMPVPSDTTQDKYYDEMGKSFAHSPIFGSYMGEMICLGGDASGVKSLKVVVEEYLKIIIEKTDPLSKQNNKIPVNITKTEFEEQEKNAGKAGGSKEKQKTDQEAGVQEIQFKKIRRSCVICYNKDIGEQGTIFFFDFWDNEEEFTMMSETFNKILYSARFLA